MASIFSKIIAGEIPSYKIAEDELFYAFLDINPLAKGHTLVVPKKEIDYFFDIEDALLAKMICFAKKVAKAIEKTIPCERIGMTVLGLEVPHAHIHLAPLDKKGFLDFTKKIELTPIEFLGIAKQIQENYK